jgi:hypothetical protein
MHFSSERFGSCLPTKIASVMSGAKKARRHGDDPVDVALIEASLFGQSTLVRYAAPPYRSTRRRHKRQSKS